MDLVRWLILVSLIVFCFAAFKAIPTHAAVLETAIVHLDAKTLAQGFTVKSPDKQFWLPIFSNEYQRPLTVKISHLENAETLPAGVQAISDFYEYQITSTEKPSELVLVSLAYQDKLDCVEAIYYFDEAKQQWQRLSSTLRPGNILQAKVPARSAKIVVAERAAGTDDLTAQSAIVINEASGDVVFAKNIDEVRPAASLTKLVSVSVFLNYNPGWDKVVTLQKSDFVGGATLWAKAGDRVTVKDLFYAALTGSKNNAMKALVRATGLSDKKFVELMNQKTKEWGLTASHFVEPTGLEEANVSTAREMALIAQKAFSNSIVRDATTAKSYKVILKNRPASYTVTNTSQKVLNRDLCVTGSKTGWTDEAGYNLVTQAKNNEKEMIALVMGARITKNYEEVYNLLKKYL